MNILNRIRLFLKKLLYGSTVDYISSTDTLPPPLSREEEGEAQGASELKHRTPKKDLLEIDRFTICGNRID